MKAIVLGSGTSVPSMRRPPAFFLQAGGCALLVDCGAGATTSLARHGIGIDALDAVLLTHLHPDHSAELVPLLFALRNPVGPARGRDLVIYGPCGTEAHLEALRGVYGDWIVPRRCDVRVVEVDEGGEIALVDATILRVFRVVHGEQALAFRIERAGRVVCFSGDTGDCAGLRAAADNVDLFFCECAALEDDGLSGHLSATQVGRIAKAVRCKRLVVTHLYQHLLATNPLERIRHGYGGPCELAEDDLLLELPPRSDTPH